MSTTDNKANGLNGAGELLDPTNCCVIFIDHQPGKKKIRNNEGNKPYSALLT